MERNDGSMLTEDNSCGVMPADDLTELAAVARAIVQEEERRVGSEVKVSNAPENAPPRTSSQIRIAGPCNKDALMGLYN